MLSWASIVYGAALSAIVAGAALTALARPRQPAVILTGALAAAAGPLGWNATLRATPASQFFTDAPLRLSPASWQDTAPAYCPSHRHRPPRGPATGRRPCQAQHRAGGEDSDGQQPTGKAGERFKVVCGCQPPRSFWIRAKQYAPGPITCGVCGQDFQPQDAGHQ
jgi:hypothetical protein